MTVQRACDVCSMYRQRPDGTSSVVRYTLRREMDQSMRGGVRARRLQASAGGIDMCGPCWERICKPNMNANKSHSRRRVVTEGVTGA